MWQVNISKETRTPAQSGKAWTMRDPRRLRYCAPWWRWNLTPRSEIETSGFVSPHGMQRFRCATGLAGGWTYVFPPQGGVTVFTVDIGDGVEPGEQQPLLCGAAAHVHPAKANGGSSAFQGNSWTGENKVSSCTAAASLKWDYMPKLFNSWTESQSNSDPLTREERD